MPQLPSRTRVVFLQHPREFRMPVGTARMAHLSLPNSELHVGVDFTDHARVQALVSSGAAVLFPGEGSVDPSTLIDSPPSTLFVLDGTWALAKKVYRVNPLLQTLPRIGLKPRRPSNYRIRKEPADHCVSTVEAVAEVLGQLEGEPDRFAPMLTPFVSMVDHQLERRAEREGPPRRREKKKGLTRSAHWQQISDALAGGVLVHAEANAYPEGSDPHFPPELVHLVALRVFDGARFEGIARPENPVAPSTCFHVELSEQTLHAGEPRAELLARFAAFAGARPLCVWGTHSLALLREEGVRVLPGVDVRNALKQWTKRKSGPVEDSAQALAGAPETPWASGRAGRRLSALAQVQRAFSAMMAARLQAPTEVPTFAPFSGLAAK